MTVYVMVGKLSAKKMRFKLPVKKCPNTFKQLYKNHYGTTSEFTDEIKEINQSKTNSQINKRPQIGTHP